MVDTDRHTPNSDHNRKGSGISISKMSKKKQSPDRVGAAKLRASPTPPGNNDPSTWTKSKKKRMRQKRKREEAAAAAAAMKLTLESGDSNTPVVSSPTTQFTSDDGDVKNKKQKLEAKKQSPNATKIDVEKSAKKTKKKKKKSKTDRKKKNAETDETETASEGYTTLTKSNEKSQMKISLPKRSMMSTLQIAFLERLTSSRFRELNEDLYTKSSQDSFKQFTEQPELFDQYHVGFRKQAKEWPVNPVDIIYKRIVTTWKKEFQAKKGQKSKTENVVVADFGCGDAKLAERLLSLTIDSNGQLVNKPPSKGRKRKQNNDKTSCPFQCHSFDLVSGGNPLVTPADISNVPLPDKSVDVGVYCLALMGTNVADFVRESWRVLKINGVLRVAEVRSRFETSSANSNSDNQNKGKFGCHKSKNNIHNQSKRSDNNEEENVPQPLMLLDEFLALMQRCGFECTNMDRSNKMFLFMDFVKAGGSGLSKDENFSAKPCIYKRR